MSRARRGAAAALVGLALWAASGPARAIVLSGSGASLSLRGAFNPGDAETFRRFLAGAGAGPGSVLHLHSHGGKVLEAIAIGRMVRAAGLATAVDARSAYCDSACTLVFVSGRRRYYTGGDAVFEGTSGQTGLGFHGANRPGDRLTGRTANAQATDTIRAFYAEMGVPGAATLVDRAAFNTYFRLSGRTAIATGVATDLGSP